MKRLDHERIELRTQLGHLAGGLSERIWPGGPPDGWQEWHVDIVVRGRKVAYYLVGWDSGDRAGHPLHTEALTDHQLDELWADLADVVARMRTPPVRWSEEEGEAAVKRTRGEA